MSEESKQDHEPETQTMDCLAHPPLPEPDPALTHAVHMGPNLDRLFRLRPQDLLKLDKPQQNREPDAQTAACSSHPTPLPEPDPALTHAVHMGPNLDRLLRLRPKDLLKPQKTERIQNQKNRP